MCTAGEFLAKAERELERHGGLARNEEAWAWYHAARREELRLRPLEDLALLEIDLRQEVLEKVGSWRRKAVDRYGFQSEGRLNRVIRIRKHVDGGSEKDNRNRLLNRVVRTQKHVDEAAENDNRKRLLQRRQVIIYLALLVAVLIVICLLEFLGRGLILPDSTVDGWWVVSAVFYGTLGGAFSSAQRVAAAGPALRYPGLRWAQLANTFRPFAGGPARSWPSPRSKPTSLAPPLARAGRASR